MNKLQKLSRSLVIIQGILLTSLGLILFVLLPANGFAGLNDLNNAEKVASVPFLMALVNWIHFCMGLSMLAVLYVLFKALRLTRSFPFSFIILIPIFGVVLWFIGHDVGFQILNWSAIAADPAGTNYTADTWLLSFRNAIYFVVTLLTYLAISNQARHTSTPSALQPN
jgi:hypothetical protein